MDISIAAFNHFLPKPARHVILCPLVFGIGEDLLPRPELHQFALQAADFQAKASQAYGLFKTALSGGWYTIDPPLERPTSTNWRPAF